MDTRITESEERFVSELLAWDQAGRRFQGMLAYLLLALGGVVFLVVVFLSLGNLNDRTALWVTAPGSLLAALFFVLFSWLNDRIDERHLVASILRKLGGVAE